MNHTNAARMVTTTENTSHPTMAFLITLTSRAIWARLALDANSGDAFEKGLPHLSQRTAESSDIVLHELHTCMAPYFSSVNALHAPFGSALFLLARARRFSSFRIALLGTEIAARIAPWKRSHASGPSIISRGWDFMASSSHYSWMRVDSFCIKPRTLIISVSASSSVYLPRA